MAKTREDEEPQETSDSSTPGYGAPPNDSAAKRYGASLGAVPLALGGAATILFATQGCPNDPAKQKQAGVQPPPRDPPIVDVPKNEDRALLLAMLKDAKRYLDIEQPKFARLYDQQIDEFEKREKKRIRERLKKDTPEDRLDFETDLEFLNVMTLKHANELAVEGFFHRSSRGVTSNELGIALEKLIKDVESGSRSLPVKEADIVDRAYQGGVRDLHSPNPGTAMRRMLLPQEDEQSLPDTKEHDDAHDRFRKALEGAYKELRKLNKAQEVGR